MYNALTTTELTILQDMLYSATEEAYKVASLAQHDPVWLGRYQPIHSEIARLFIESGQELLSRLDHGDEVWAA